MLIAVLELKFHETEPVVIAADGDLLKVCAAFHLDISDNRVFGVVPLIVMLGEGQGLLRPWRASRFVPSAVILKIGPQYFGTGIRAHW